jgi:hypothetical protein
MTYPTDIDPTERTIIDLAIRDILAALHAISVYGDCELDCPASTDYEEITSHVAACSQTEFIIWTDPIQNGAPRRKVGWVMFVHGNGCDVLSDYTANDKTEALLSRANAETERLQEA